MESMNDQLVAGSFCKAWRKKRSGENEPSCMWADQHTIYSPSVAKCNGYSSNEETDNLEHNEEAIFCTLQVCGYVYSAHFLKV